MYPIKFSVILNSKIKSFNKTIEVDPDKSLSIRSFLIGSIAQKISSVSNVLESEDVKKNTLLNFGNSGTLARLLIGILSTTPGLELMMTGDKSLNKRNMKSLIDLMSKFGAIFLPKNKYTFPLKIISSNIPIGIYYKTGVSAQLKSAVMLAGTNSNGNTIGYND